LYIAPSQISSQFPREQFGIGASDIDVTVQFYPERIDTFFPGFYFLNLIKKEVYLPFDSSCAADDLIMESRSRAERRITHIFKVDRNDLAAVHAGRKQFLLDKSHHDRLTAAANTGQDFHQLRPNKRPNAAHIAFSLNQ